MKLQVEESSTDVPLKESESGLVRLRPLTNAWCDEYCAGNQEYVAKFKEATKGFTRVRQMSPDGNCFYQAVVVAIVEKIYENAETYRPTYTNLAKLYYDRLIQRGYSKITVTDFYEMFVDLISKAPCCITNSSTDREVNSLEGYLDEAMKDSDMMNYSFVFMRLMLSCYLKENEATYQAYLVDGMTVETFCKNNVEPIQKYCDNIQIDALVKIFSINVNILAVSPKSFFSCVIPEGSTPIDLNLLYNNSHYDIIYK